MSAPMNMEEWQRRMRAEKEAQRKKKTESAEMLRGYRGGVNDEELKLRALREEERRKTMDAQNHLHSYKGKGLAVVEQPKPRKTEVTNHPVPVNAGSSATKDYWAGVDIVAGSVSERASALAAAADGTGVIPSPTAHQSGVKATLLAESSEMENGTEARASESNAQEQEKVQSEEHSVLPTVEESVIQPEERSVLAPVEESDIQSEEVLPSVEESVPHLEEGGITLNSVPNGVDDLGIRELDDEKKESTPSDMEQPISSSPDSLAVIQSKEIDPVSSCADTKEQSPAVEQETCEMKTPATEVPEMDLQAAVVEPGTNVPVTEEPEKEVKAAEENGDNLISDAVEAEAVTAHNRAITAEVPVVDHKAASATGLAPLEIPSNDVDALPFTPSQGSMKSFPTSPETPSDGPKRTNVMFSFGVVSTQDRPDLFGYMKAVEKVICRSLENNSEGMRFDPKFRPFVKKTDPDGSFTPQSDRSDIKRTLVTAAVPVFFQAPATKVSTKKAVVDALQRCIQSGEFLDLAQAH